MRSHHKKQWTPNDNVVAQPTDLLFGVQNWPHNIGSTYLVCPLKYPLKMAFFDSGAIFTRRVGYGLDIYGSIAKLGPSIPGADTSIE